MPVVTALGGPVDHDSDLPLHEQLERQLREDIQAGRLAPGRRCRRRAGSPPRSACRAASSPRPTASSRPRAIWRSARARRCGSRPPSSASARASRRARCCPPSPTTCGRAFRIWPAFRLTRGCARSGRRSARRRSRRSASRTRAACPSCARRSPPSSRACAAPPPIPSTSSSAAASAPASRRCAGGCARRAPTASRSRTRAGTRTGWRSSRRGSRSCRCPSTSRGCASTRWTASGSSSSRPAHQFPTGAVLSRERRAALVEWAAAHEALIVEDDYDSELSDQRPGALQGLAPERVVLIGSLSKRLAPGLRLGWMLSPSWLTWAITSGQAIEAAGGDVIAQLALRDFLERGELERHLRRMRSRYAARRATLLDALRRLPEVRVRETPPAGLFVLADCDGDESAIVARAAQAGVGLEGLGLHRFEPGGPAGSCSATARSPSPRSSAPSTCSARRPAEPQQLLRDRVRQRQAGAPASASRRRTRPAVTRPAATAIATSGLSEYTSVIWSRIGMNPAAPAPVVDAVTLRRTFRLSRVDLGGGQLAGRGLQPAQPFVGLRRRRGHQGTGLAGDPDQRVERGVADAVDVVERVFVVVLVRRRLSSSSRSSCSSSASGTDHPSCRTRHRLSSSSRSSESSRGDRDPHPVGAGSR